MREGRIPAQRGVTFCPGRHIEQHHKPSNAKIKSVDATCQTLLAPNYCKHIPSVPKLFIVPSNHKPRAKIVQETINKLAAAYVKPKGSLKTLQFHDKSGHRVKSQRREAAISLLQVMNYYQDDATGSVGRFLQDGAFRPIPLKKLAKYANLELRRAKRAMRDIVRSGYLKVTRQFIRDDESGQVKGLPSLRSFLPKFFMDLEVKGDLWTKWFSQREWSKQREEKRISKQQRKKSHAMIGLFKQAMGSTVKKIAGIIKTVPSVQSEKETEARIYQEKNLMEKAKRMFEADPSRSPLDYLRDLKQSQVPK